MFVVNLAPLGPENIILANPSVMIQPNVSLPYEDPLDAMEEGGDDNENVDIFLNLEKLHDVDMPTDSGKRKRIDAGEAFSSQA